MDVLTLYHLLFSPFSAYAALVAGGLSLLVGSAALILFYRRPAAFHLSRFNDTPLGRRLSVVQGWALSLRSAQRLLPALLIYGTAWAVYANGDPDRLPVWRAAAIYSLLAVAVLLVLGSFLWGPKVDRALGQIGQTRGVGGAGRSLAPRVAALHALEGKPNAPALFPFLYQSMVARLQNLRLGTELPWRWRDLTINILFAGCTLAVLLLFLGSLASLVNETAEQLQSQGPLLAQRTPLPPAPEPEKKETAPPFPPEETEERTGGENGPGSSPAPHPESGPAPPDRTPEASPESRVEKPDASSGPGQGPGDPSPQDSPSDRAPEVPPDQITPPEREPSGTPPEEDGLPTGPARADSPGEPQPKDGATPRETPSPDPEPKPDGEPGERKAPAPAAAGKEGAKEETPSPADHREKQPAPGPEPRPRADSPEETASKDPDSTDPSPQQKPCPSPSCSQEKPCGSCSSPGAGKDGQPAATRGKETKGAGKPGSAAPSQTPEQLAENEGTSAPGSAPDGKEREKPGAEQTGAVPEDGPSRDDRPPRTVSAPPMEPSDNHGDGSGPPRDRGGRATEGPAGNREYEEMKIRSQPSRNQDLAGKDFEPQDGTPPHNPAAPPASPRHNPRVDLKPNRYVEPLPLAPQRVPAEYRTAFRRLFQRDE